MRVRGLRTFSTGVGARSCLIGLTFLSALVVHTAPVQAEPSYVAEGRGIFTGWVHYGGAGLAALSPCARNTFTLTASAETVFFDAALVGFVGPITVAAVGSPYSCETLAAPEFSRGWLDLTLTGTGPLGSTITCTAADEYSRDGTYVTWSTYSASTHGTCTVNGYTTQVIMGLSFNLVPTGSPIVDAAAPGQLNMIGDCPWSC